MIKKILYTAPAFVLIALLAACNGNDKTPSAPPESPAASTVKNISLSVINTYPHDTGSFTQGLVIYKGQLYEGTGGSDYAPEGRPSELMRMNLQTGKAEQHITLDKKYFGEGITILHDTVYQLTWKEKVVFVYTLPDMKKVKEFPINTEGWGITTDGKELIISDGTSNLYFYDPSDFRLLRTQSVTMDGNFMDSLNELEYIDGFVYANRWNYPVIFKIDPASGIIAGQVDVSGIWDRLKKRDPRNAENVPNGIAYDQDTKKIYITGKNWPELYEVQFGN
ncbi:glutaminyl-peptide cyclotransferase [Niabella drilacis]|uniref:Glutamine cyclotransferase n=1 Tax=Niabella drilacis (strain DSM 25811 / CCM 8410 / CCUG 62505 / LMG 26954 / E90) TaxID=1285928 RepID=A0A1G6V5S6_NIADE|nr:glutaminyl-peptide cyclotransferase [Niabella drilacis]SDD48245.1 Glutamine cyclotransferase [Niabella drilacis]